MNEDLRRQLSRDPDGLLTYEYIANHIGECEGCITDLVDNMIAVDTTGQFLVSAARYLGAIDREAFRAAIDRMVAVAIDRDRERRYIGDLLPALWGADYQARADQLSAADNNFRRIYKRLHPSSSI